MGWSQQSMSMGMSQGCSQGSDVDRTADSSTIRLLECQSRSLSTSSVRHLLTEEQRKTFKGLVLVASDMIKNGKLKKGALASNLAKIKNLPLEVLWWYQCSNIMHISIYISLNLGESDELERIGSGLNELMATEAGDATVAAIVSDFLYALVKMIYGPEPPSVLLDTRKACHIILLSILRKQLQLIKDGTRGVWWLHTLLGEPTQLPASVQYKCATELLTMQLTEPPYVSVHQALMRQSEWTFSLAPTSITTCFTSLLKALGPQAKALDAFVRILQGGSEVNWKSVLICVSTFLHSFTNAASHMAGLLSEHLSAALEVENRDMLVLCFLLARQCAIEGTAVNCPSYPTWFKKTFGSRSTSLASAPNQCEFLLGFLSQLVPHEPAACLKAHLDQVPWVPPSCRADLQDYMMLAGTRLKDLGQGSTERATGFFLSDNPLTLEEQVNFDITKCVEYFEKSGKVHGSLLEGSMFLKKYYESHFIPQLLKPRSSATSNDTQTLLIDKLLKVGKISTAQYNSYHSQCLAANSSSS